MKRKSKTLVLFFLGVASCTHRKEQPQALDAEAGKSIDLVFQAGRAEFPGCERYPFGKTEGLKKELIDSSAKGLACLQTFPLRKNDAKNLVELWESEHRFRFECVKGLDPAYRTTSGPNRPGFPKMTIFSEGVKARRPLLEQREGSLFHGLLHTIGYRHFRDYDLPFIAKLCCFTKREDACELLRQDVRYDSEEYLSRFVPLMVSEALAEEGLRTLWRVVQLEQKNLSPQEKARLFLRVDLKTFELLKSREGGNWLACDPEKAYLAGNAILLQAALLNLTPSEAHEWAGKFRAKGLGILVENSSREKLRNYALVVAALMKGDEKSALKSLKAVLKKEPKMSLPDRKQIDEIIDMTEEDVGVVLKSKKWKKRWRRLEKTN